MAYEKGGRADKAGNRFEYNWIIYNLLQVIEEKIQYVIIEAIGEDEEGVDLWIGNLDGSREGQQCKGRYGSEDSWTYGSVNAKGIWTKWKKQLEREDKVKVSLVSPLAFTLFEDLTARARNTNENPKDFYKYQIGNDNVSNDTKRLYKNYCNIMGIDCSDNVGIMQSIDYLSRTYYRQRPDYELKDIILDKIHMQFLGKHLDIYGNFLQLILAEDILAKKINIIYLDSYLRNCGVEYRNLAKDTRILPRIRELNDEYRRNFISFQDGIIIRHEFKKCKKMIDEGQSFIIDGNAGIGKSGCIENIIDYCNNENILYLAIKLDKRIPKDTSENWGISMGLPTSPALCIDAISKNSKAVLVFDQLDALRWTQAHCGNALDVCMQTIKEVEILNKDREHNISIVFVSRTYDLLNDRGIKNLFSKKSEYSSFEWKKVKIGELDLEDIKLLVGTKFNNLSKKTKKLLAISSNMYIWQHLNNNITYIPINTTRQLVHEWWKQLQLKAENSEINSKYLIEILNKIVSFCNNNGRINAPNSIIQIPANYAVFLQSNGFLTIMNEIVSFTHQSILDIFLSDYMVREYYSGKNIIEIIGNKHRQIPGRRYQLQLFMEQMMEDSEKEFLNLGKKILISKSVRFSFKFVFLEALAVITSPSKMVSKFICQMCEDIQWGSYIIDNVITGNKAYISIIQEEGILESWLNHGDHKRIAIRLYASIANSLDNEHLTIIKKFIFQDEEMLDEWSRCFSWRIAEDSDELFDLRMQFYERYPRYLERYIVVKDMFKECEIRTIKLLALMLKEKIKKYEKTIYKYEEEFILEDTEIIVNEYETIIKTFLPLLPKADEVINYSDWSARYSYRIGIERTCIQILKKANACLISINPEEFWNIYNNYMYTGNDLYNEIILDGLYHLPEEYDDKVVEYLCAGFDLTLFEETSGNGNCLLSGKRLLEKVSLKCSKEYYIYLEKTIIKYKDKYAIYKLKERINYNRKREYQVYWRFWGDFQRECLEVLPKERLSIEAFQLLEMFSRYEENYQSIYDYNNGHSGGVFSPVANKSISYTAWRGILTNSRIPVHRSHNFKKVAGGFIEVSQETFARSLEDRIKKEGTPFLEYILNIDLPISNIFVQSIYSAIALSEQLSEIDTVVIERLIEKFGYDYEDYRAISIVRIFERKTEAKWSERSLSVLFDIALRHKNPELKKPNVIPQDDKEIVMVESIEANVINSVRSKALQAIGELIWNNDKMMERFLEPINKAITDSNPIIRYASQFVLWPIYNINRKWASEKIIVLYENDVRMAGFHDSKTMLLYLYKEYREKVIDIVNKMFLSEDKRLIEISEYTIAELYLLYDEYRDIIVDKFNFSKEQKKAILEMLIVYVGVENYREKAKLALIYNINDSFNMEFPWASLFYKKLVNLDKDREFIDMILNSIIGTRILDAFFNFIEENKKGVRNYESIILQLCKKLIETDTASNENIWLYQDKISKMIISLYDASSDDLEEDNSIAIQCLDLWDVMYEKQIGMARELTKKMIET